MPRYDRRVFTNADEPLCSLRVQAPTVFVGQAKAARLHDPALRRIYLDSRLVRAVLR